MLKPHFSISEKVRRIAPAFLTSIRTHKKVVRGLFIIFLLLGGSALFAMREGIPSKLVNFANAALDMVPVKQVVTVAKNVVAPNLTLDDVNDAIHVALAKRAPQQNQPTRTEKITTNTITERTNQPIINNTYNTYNTSSSSSSTIQQIIGGGTTIDVNQILASTGDLVNKTIDGTLNTITNLGVVNFATDVVSQFTNDIGFITDSTVNNLTNKTIDAANNTINNLGVGNFASDLLSQFTNDLNIPDADDVAVLSNKTFSALANTISDIGPGNLDIGAMDTWVESLGYITENSVGALTGKTINAANNTIENLDITNFASDAVSQFSNDIGFITSGSTETLTNKIIDGASNTISNLDVSNFASDLVSQWNNDAGFITNTANILGNAATATLADTAALADEATHAINATTADVATLANDAMHAVSADLATLASTVTNGVYTTGSYADPSWITSINGNKLAGTITASAIAAGSYGIDVTGNAATATLADVATLANNATNADEAVHAASATIADTATLANAVVNGVVTTGSYANPSWITELVWSKISSLPTTLAGYGIVDPVVLTSGSYSNPSWISNLDGGKLSGIVTATNGVVTTGSYANPSWITSLNGTKLIGTVTANAIASGSYAIDVTGNAATVTNGIISTGSYANPSWLTGLAWSKLSSVPTTLSGYGITDPVVLTSGSYSNPSWITGLDGSKLSGTVTATNGVVTTGSYSNPSWLTGLDGSKLTGTVVATNGVVTTGSYSNPSWITGLTWSKLSSVPTTLSGYGITDPVVLTSGSYTDPTWITSLAGSKLSGTVTATNGVITTGSYSDPSWITGLAGSKLTGTITATNGVVTTGSYSNPAWITGLAWSKLSSIPTTLSGYGITDPIVLTNGTYSNPTWITSLDGGKLSGTVTANALAYGSYSATNLTATSNVTAGGIVGTNTIIASGTLANTLLSGGCVVNVNALNLAAFQTSATITTSHIFYNSSRNRHSRIGSVSTCNDSGGNPWRIISLTDTISSSAAGDSYAIYSPDATIGNGSSGFFGNLYAINLRGLVSTLTGGFDIAEQYQTTDETIDAGTIVAIDEINPHMIRKSNTVYDDSAIGIISTQPGLTLGGEQDPTWKPVALTGRVPVRVTNENGPIVPGDMITSSSVPGIGMKATRAGTMIGKALESFDSTEPGTIIVFVQTGYANVSSAVTLASIQNAVSTDGIVFDQIALFNGGLKTDYIGSIGDHLELLSDTFFIGRPYFNSDTAGFAIIHSGELSVRITYDKEYVTKPVVNVTVEESFGNYTITQNSTTGFTINLENRALSDITFNWIALAVKDVKTSQNSSQPQAGSPVIIPDAPTTPDEQPTDQPDEIVSPTPDQPSNEDQPPAEEPTPEPGPAPEPSTP